MNTNKEYLKKKIDTFGTALSGGIAALAVTLVVNDSKVVVENITLSAVLLFTAFMVYVVTSAIVYLMSE